MAWDVKVKTGLFFILLGFRVTPAIAADVSFSVWTKQLLTVVSDSPTLAALTASAESYEDNYRLEYRQSPFTLISGLNYGAYSPNPNFSTNLQRMGLFVFNNQLNYQANSSFSAALQLSSSLGNFPAGVLPTDSEIATLTLSYDLIRGGSSGLLWSQARGRALASLRQYYEVLSSLIGTRVQAYRAGILLYVAQCKIRRLKSAQVSISDTVEGGRVQVKAKTLAFKDFLNFQNLENSFTERLAREQLNAQQLKQNLSIYGEGVEKISEQLNSPLMVCDSGPKFSDAQISGYKLDPTTLDAVAKSLPSVMAAQSAKEGAFHELRAAQITNKVSLSPFVSGGYVKQDAFSSQITPPSVQVGVNLVWNIPGTRGALNEEQAKAKLNSRNFSLRAEYQNSIARLGVLQNELNSQLNILNILEKNLDNSDTLLRVLDTQRAIGNVESLNFSVAYLANVDAQNAIFDSWGAIEGDIFEISEYKNFAKAHAPLSLAGNE